MLLFFTLPLCVSIRCLVTISPFPLWTWKWYGRACYNVIMLLLVESEMLTCIQVAFYALCYSLNYFQNMEILIKGKRHMHLQDLTKSWSVKWQRLIQPLVWINTIHFKSNIQKSQECLCFGLIVSEGGLVSSQSFSDIFPSTFTRERVMNWLIVLVIESSCFWSSAGSSWMLVSIPP